MLPKTVQSSGLRHPLHASYGTVFLVTLIFCHCLMAGMFCYTHKRILGCVHTYFGFLCLTGVSHSYIIFAGRPPWLSLSLIHTCNWPLDHHWPRILLRIYPKRSGMGFANQCSGYLMTFCSSHGVRQSYVLIAGKFLRCSYETTTTKDRTFKTIQLTLCIAHECSIGRSPFDLALHAGR